MKLEGTLVIERTQRLTFDVGELVAHWTDEERAELLDEVRNDEHGEAYDALKDNALGEMNKAYDTETDIWVQKCEVYEFRGT